MLPAIIAQTLVLKMPHPSSILASPVFPVALDDDISKAFWLIALSSGHLPVPAISTPLPSFSLDHSNVFGSAYEPEGFCQTHPLEAGLSN